MPNEIRQCYTESQCLTGALIVANFSYQMNQLSQVQVEAMINEQFKVIFLESLGFIQ